MNILSVLESYRPILALAGSLGGGDLLPVHDELCEAVADLLKKAEKLADNDFTFNSGTAHLDAQELRAALVIAQGGAE